MLASYRFHKQHFAWLSHPVTGTDATELAGIRIGHFPATRTIPLVEVDRLAACIDDDQTGSMVLKNSMPLWSVSACPISGSTFIPKSPGISLLRICMVWLAESFTTNIPRLGTLMPNTAMSSSR